MTAVDASRARNGYFAEIISTQNNSLIVRYDGVLVESSEGLPFSPETNSRGDLAYAACLAGLPKGDLALADIYVNGQKIISGKPVLDLAMSDTVLSRIESAPQGTVLRSYNIETGEFNSRFLPFYTQRIGASIFAFVIASFPSALQALQSHARDRRFDGVLVRNQHTMMGDDV